MYKDTEEQLLGKTEDRAFSMEPNKLFISNIGRICLRKGFGQLVERG